MVHGEDATDSIARELCPNEPGMVIAAQDRLIDVAMSMLNYRERLCTIFSSFSRISPNFRADSLNNRADAT